MNSGLRHIAVIGNGFEGSLTAATLAHSLSGAGVDVSLYPVADCDRWDAMYATLPAGPDDLVSTLGLGDLDLFQIADAGFSLGANIRNRCAQPAGRLKAFGPCGIDFGGVGFHHYWRRCRGDNALSDYFAYSPGNVAMAAGRYAPPVARNAIGPLQHEYARHVNPWKLASRLRQVAESLGVKIMNEEVPRQEANPADHLTFRTAGGSVERADLCVDCSGPADVLGRRGDWVAAPGSVDFDLQLESRLRAPQSGPWYDVLGDERGWQVDIPQGDEVLGIRLQEGESAGAPYRSGRIRRAWQSNVVAIGHAAVALPPIEPLQSTALMLSVRRLINLLPGRECRPEETAEFNQLFARDIDDALQLMTLHEAGRASDELLEGLTQSAEALAGLARAVNLFIATGRLPASDAALVEPHQWINTLIFYGIEPSRLEALALRPEQRELEQRLAGLRSRIEEVVAEFPTHAFYLEQVRAAARGDAR